MADDDARIPGDIPPDRVAPTPELERERQRRRWEQWCEGRLDRPTLTPEERARWVPPFTDYKPKRRKK